MLKYIRTYPSSGKQAYSIFRAFKVKVTKSKSGSFVGLLSIDTYYILLSLNSSSFFFFINFYIISLNNVTGLSSVFVFFFTFKMTFF